MTPSEIQLDSDSRDATRRALQFSTKELLCLVAIVAVACGMVRWLGPIAAAFLYVAVAPISAFSFLVARRGCSPHEMLGFCCISTALTWFALPLYTTALNAEAGTNTAWPVSYVLIPFVVGTVGANVGILVSLPFVGLRYVVRSLRRMFIGPPETPVATPSDPAP